MLKIFYRKNAILILIIISFIITEFTTARGCFKKGYDHAFAEVKHEEALKQEETLKASLIAFDPAEYKDNLYSADAKAIARVLYGLTDYQLSDEAKQAIVEVIISRVKCTYGEFGDDIQSVCNKPEQWQGYAKDGNYLQHDYDLVMRLLTSEDVGRITPEGCLYLTCSNGEVAVRKEWDSKNVWKVS